MREKDQPKCFGKCASCFYNQINACMAIAGDDLYISFSDRELSAMRTSRYHRTLQSNIQIAKTYTPERVIA